LIRGIKLKLPSGQRLADKYNLEKAVIKSDDEFYKALESSWDKIIRKSWPNGKYTFDEFCQDTPLWFYILMEAYVLGNKVRNKGECLGPLGSQIVGDTIIGLIAQTPESILSKKGEDWKPKFFKNGISNKQTYTMIDLLEFTGIYNGAKIN